MPSNFEGYDFAAALEGIERVECVKDGSHARLILNASGGEKLFLTIAHEGIGAIINQLQQAADLLSEFRGSTNPAAKPTRVSNVDSLAVGSLSDRPGVLLTLVSGALSHSFLLDNQARQPNGQTMVEHLSDALAKPQTATKSHN